MIKDARGPMLTPFRKHQTEVKQLMILAPYSTPSTGTPVELPKAGEYLFALHTGGGVGDPTISGTVEEADSSSGPWTTLFSFGPAGMLASKTRLERVNKRFVRATTSITGTQIIAHAVILY